MAPGLVDMSSTQNGNSNFEELLPDDDDLLYEEELLRNPYSLRMWVRYLEARKDAAQKRRFLLYERAISALPGSYKVTTVAEPSLLCASTQTFEAGITVRVCCSFGMHISRSDVL